MNTDMDDLLGHPVISGHPSIMYNDREFSETDDPDTIRWRADWLHDGGDALAVGIILYAYPVVRKTARAAWIDTHAFRVACSPQPDGSTRRWAYTEMRKLVYDGSGAAWAKPTRDEALQSLGVRLMRWRGHVLRDIERVNAALDVASALLESPEAGASDSKRFVFSANRVPAKGFKL